MNQNQNNDPKNDGPKNRQSLLVLLVCIMISLVCINLLSRMTRNMTSEISYSEFIEMLENGEVESVVLRSDTLTITPKTQRSMTGTTEIYTTLMEDESDLTKRLDEAGVENFSKEPPDMTSSIIYSLLSIILPVIIMVGLLSWLFRRMNKGGGMMGGVGKSKAKAYVQKETGVTFKDVAGEDEAKESLQEVVDFLHNPGKYAAIGAKLPKGALLVGPPGTGKTLLAKAVAGEAHVPFFSLSGSDFVEMFVGVGASRVRDLFEEAKKNAPCIIFIDEVDAIGKTRDSRYGGNDEREQTLNQLLAEMDGFDTSKGLLILAATNRPEVLDPALLRPGRFDRRIIVDRPDLKGRVNILKVHAKNVSLDETVDLDAIALATSGAVGSDLANMINEAAILAVKHGRKAVSQKDLLEAVEVVLVGKEKKDRILSAEERKIVSYHEVGHALVRVQVIAVGRLDRPGRRVEQAGVAVRRNAAGQAEQTAGIQRRGLHKAAVRRHHQLFPQELHDLLGRFRPELQPDRRQFAAFFQQLAHDIAEVDVVVHHPLIHRNVRIAGDAEQAGFLHRVLAEDGRGIVGDQLLHKGIPGHVAVLGKQDPLELVADRDDAVMDPVGLGVQLYAEVDLLVAQEGERMALVHDLRAQDREDLPLEIGFPEMFLLFVQLAEVHLLVSLLAQRRHQVLPVLVALGLQFRHPRGDGGDLFRRRHVGDNVQLVVFQQGLVIQRPHADHEKLIHIAGKDGGKLQALPQRDALLLCQRQHTAVKVQPAQFPIDKDAVLFQNPILPVLLPTQRAGPTSTKPSQLSTIRAEIPRTSSSSSTVRNAPCSAR